MKEIEFEGIKYYLGENAHDNWNILKISNQNWLWFHLEKKWNY